MIQLPVKFSLSCPDSLVLSEEEERFFIFDNEMKDSSKSSGAANIRRTSFGWLALMGSAVFLMAEMLVNVGEQI